MGNARRYSFVGRRNFIFRCLTDSERNAKTLTYPHGASKGQHEWFRLAIFVFANNKDNGKVSHVFIKAFVAATW